MRWPSTFSSSEGSGLNFEISRMYAFRLSPPPLRAAATRAGFAGRDALAAVFFLAGLLV
jgi:hypothetical protein